MIYNPQSCDLACVGDSNEVYRLNLEIGRFNPPFVSDCPDLTSISYSNKLNLIATGSSTGIVEFFDPKSKSKVSQIMSKSGLEISKVNYDLTGMRIGVGNVRGKVDIYDLRYPLPLHTLTHHYRLPIHSIKFHPNHKILTADSKIVKIYDDNSFDLFTNIEPKNPINDIELCKDTGLVLMAQE